MKTGKCDLCGERGVRLPNGLCPRCEIGRKEELKYSCVPNDTAEQVWRRASKAAGMSNRKERILINNSFRMMDDSHLYPINGRCNVTERAIRAARRFERESGCMMDGLEYALFLEAECSRIVNDPKNQ